MNSRLFAKYTSIQRLEDSNLRDDAMQDLIDTLDATASETNPTYHQGASHGPWCKIKSYPRTCDDCGNRVIYWECHHGCIVYFDPDEDSDEERPGKHWCLERFLRLRQA